MKSSQRYIIQAALAFFLIGAVTACRVMNSQSPAEWGEISDGSRTTWTENSPNRVMKMSDLAHDLDQLERHIDWFGSVTAKSPDVYGQARLTQYREEFEKAMSTELDGFKYVVNGAQNRSDQTYAASATALSFAIQPRPPVVGSVSSNKSSLVDQSKTAFSLAQDPATGAISLSKTTSGTPSSSSSSGSSSSVSPIDLGDPGTLIADPNKVINRNDVKMNKLGFAGTANGVIGIEPTEYLAQKQRYLAALQQIRRENEGDDIADSPGFSLNLLRIPVSVLPGKKTDMGYAAEIGMTLTPVLGDELLQMTFRNMLVNDLENQLGFPMVQQFADKNIEKLLNTDFEEFLHLLVRLNDYLTDPDSINGQVRANAYLKYLKDHPKRTIEIITQYGTPEMKKNLGPFCKRSTDKPITDICCVFSHFFNTSNDKLITDTENTIRSLAIYEIPTNKMSELGKALPTSYKTPSISFANGLDNRTAVPTSQLLYVYGPEAMFDISFAAYNALSSTTKKQKYAHLPDIQAYLREETRAALEFLKKNSQLWKNHCTEELVLAIRSQRWAEVNSYRQAYRREVAYLTGAEPVIPSDNFDKNRSATHFSHTTGLGWALIVDAALLNDRLMRDMKETASAKGQTLTGFDRWMHYFLPEPPAECRQAFNDYVKLRWPIHIFALDPYNQEQNIADSLSTRNEIQLALAIAFTNGQMSARNLSRWARRLEADYETVSLNRTQIGFSHGDNTFGWRFYPRYQTPDTPSNAQDFIQGQLIGGPNRDQLLRQRRLEPGVRECVAIVLMPSFVPYVKLDTVTNWFPITNPKHKVLDHTQAMKLSRTVQTIKTGSCSISDAHQYRDGEARRLTIRADQLESRLPTQTLTSAVPILNSLGGFEMFSNGTSDLAPEIFGWYGAPGIDPEADSTTLFLVGDHFSPLRSQVIVGNRVVDRLKQTMLSRQVMQITFDKGAYSISDGEAGGGTVRIHLATPYGVTRELEVPVIKLKPAPKSGFSFGNAKLVVNYGILAEGQTMFRPAPGCSGNTEDLKIAWNSPTGVLPSHVSIEFEFSYEVPGIKSPVPLKIPCHALAIGKVDAKEITIPKEVLDKIAAELITQIAVAGSLPLDPNPLDKGLKSTKVTIKPLVPPGAFAQTATTVDNLTVEFKPGAACAQGPVVVPNEVLPVPNPVHQ